MEKKTIGGFIAALRKANGMTQKDLAERLNVSDKTVSRWERDEGAPDLSVIPVIAVWSAYNLSWSKAAVFDSYESFIEYMEQDIPYDADNYYNVWLSGSDEHPITQAPESTANHEAIEWYDKDGNIISEEEALTRTLEDANGNVVCTYLAKNNNVTSIRYAAKDGTVLPIKVITKNNYRAAAGLSNMINTLYFILYPVELLVVLLIYFKKRAK